MTALTPAAGALLDLAASGRGRPAIDFVLDLLERGMIADEIVTDVLARVQREAGRRWEANLWDVADEHVVTAALDGALGALALATLVPDPPRGTALVACAEGEHHTMPARMGAELLRAEGWDVTFLGGSLPASDLQRYAGVTEPDLVVISCTVPLYLPGARRGFAALGELGLPTMAAGAAFAGDAARARRLGAGGLIGPTTRLATVLDEVHDPVQATPAPAEAFAMALAGADLERSCLSAVVERVPELADRSPGQLAGTRADVGSILGHLTAAIDVGDDEVFTTFTRWLAHVLDVRGVPPVVLDRCLDVIGEVVAAAGLDEAARLCNAHRAARAR